MKKRFIEAKAILEDMARSEFLRPIIAVLFVLVSGCDSVSTRWHKYQNDRVEVRGRNSDEIEVISHQWKIIDKSATTSDAYEWGWEVTIKRKEGPENENLEDSLDSLLDRVDRIFAVGITEIEYTLYDKDQFKLASSMLNLDHYGGWLRKDFKKVVNPIPGQTVTYRQTAEIPTKYAKRAVLGVCRIEL